MDPRDYAKESAQGFIDNIYDQMRKEGYPEAMQRAIMSQIKSQLNS